MPEVVLTFQDSDGGWCEVTVATRRFTIGCSADNDLVINHPGVARRHAVIENFDSGVLLYDCQTEHGTRLNNGPLSNSGGSLRNGDLITLGDACDLTVGMRLPTPGAPAAPEVFGAAARRSITTSISAWPRSPHVHTRAIAAVTIALVFVALGLLLVARQRALSGKIGNVNNDVRQAAPAVNQPAVNSMVPSGERVSAPVDATAISLEELELAAVAVVKRASGDRRSYGIPTEALPDIRRQIEEYRQSASLRANLTAMQRGKRDVAAQARVAGIEPELVIYAALALSDDGGDVTARARALVPQLSQLRIPFGSDAESCLLVIAAYTDGTGSRQSHPLLATIRRLQLKPFTERNVWYLRAQGGLSDAAYRFVIQFLATGVIAQDPRRYGLPVDRLSY